MKFSVRLKKYLEEKNFIILPIMLIMLSLFFAICAAHESCTINKEQEKFKAIAAAAAKEESKTSHSTEITESKDNETILPQYVKLAQQNPNLYGWIKINDTVLDYPVMHTPDDPEKYLRLNFDNEYSIAGSVFMDYRCSGSSDNIILYGHNMENGSMFSSILNYQDKKYWEKHKIIHFDTLYKQQDYEVTAAFFDYVHNADDTGFKYYNFIDSEDEKDFDNAISFFKEKSLYDTGITPQYGDQLLTLSTCSYHVKNGRFVVVARKI